MLTTLGNRKYTQKPVGIEVGQLQKELMTLGTTEISPLELLYAIGQNGRSFKPAIYTEGSALHNEDFLQTEVIGIDIDVKEGNVDIYSLNGYMDKNDMMVTTPLVYYRDRREDVKNIPLLLFPNFTKDIVITTSKKYKTNKTKKENQRTLAIK